jgi:hypothetical protein
MIDEKDRYRPRRIEDQAISLINGPPPRDDAGAIALRPWHKDQRPLRAVMPTTWHTPKPWSLDWKVECTRQETKFNTRPWRVRGKVNRCSRLNFLDCWR